VPMMKSIGFVEENAIYFIVMLIVPNELRKNYGYIFYCYAYSSQ
jgi:hypothetical protein